MKILSVQEFNEFEFKNLPLQRTGRGNRGTKRKTRYKDIVTAFDIETSKVPGRDEAVMYIWQWAFDEEEVVMGRTWQEFHQLCRILEKTLNEHEALVIYVHNLSFEFQFLSGIYSFKPEEVFAVDSRKVLKCSMYDGKLEFRCAYLQSNMSLAKFTEAMDVKNKKLSGEDFDYSVHRMPWTPLKAKELEYCVNDVVGLVQCIKTEMEKDGDNLYTIPMTSTGYVRRDCKRAMHRVSKSLVPSMVPNLHIYEMCREAFRGGNTHANRFYVGKTLKEVSSIDRSSSYPDVQCNRKFPMGRFFEAGEQTYKQVQDLIITRGKAVLMRVYLKDVKLRNPYWGAPYIPRDKCRVCQNGVFDNGRVLSADLIDITLTDIDFKIILEEYDFAVAKFYDVAYTRYGVLPEPLIHTIIKYYTNKTALKGVPGQEYFYMKDKNKLNSIYGMSAQNPVKQDIIYENGEWREADGDIEEILEKSNRRAFEPYQWGVWTTAWARWELEQGIKAAGENFVYADTDSVKYIGDLNLEEYNRKKKLASSESGAFAKDPKGKMHFMGVFEFEETYKEFRTLGAKKYVYVDKGGELHVTIAGVDKAEGGKELEKYGGIRAFKEGFIFRDAGGLEAVYNDRKEAECIEIEGHELWISSNVLLKPSEYTLGITAEYARLLEDCSLELNRIKEIKYNGKCNN